MSGPWKLGLLGVSLGHSQSPALFGELFKSAGAEGVYELLEFQDWESCEGFLKSDAAAGFAGFNVTVPFKSEAAAFCAELGGEAAAAGAVNVMLPIGAGRYRGENTDVQGFLGGVRPFLERQHERALVFGRGGAARAVAVGLEGLGIDVVHVVREVRPANPWRELASGELREEVVRAWPLIVQATPIGTHPDVDACLPMIWEGVGEGHLVVDLVYNPAETAFMKRARAQGATVLNGLPMLQGQARMAWNLFRDNQR